MEQVENQKVIDSMLRYHSGGSDLKFRSGPGGIPAQEASANITKTVVDNASSGKRTPPPKGEFNYIPQRRRHGLFYRRPPDHERETM